MKLCSKCNQTYPDDANFCLTDGTPLKTAATEKQCPKCQRTYPPEAGFCMVEGTPLVEATQTSDTPAKPARAKTKPAKVKSPRKKRQPKSASDDQREIFTRGMTRWFQQMSFGVGLAPNRVDKEQSKKFAEGVLEVAHELFDLDNSIMWISGGAGSEELFRALTPYVPLCSLLGSRIVLDTVKLVPVIFGDELTAAEIKQRFTQIIELAEPLTEFGPRLNFRSMGQAVILPLIVYFDPSKYAAHLSEVMPDGWQRKGQIALQASLVNVPEQKVEFAERTGIYGIGEKMADLMGQKVQVFESSDIAGVMILGKSPDATS